jgi:hypothetical protein
MKLFVFLTLAACLVMPGRADTLVHVDAGELTGPDGATMSIDDSTPSSNGSLLLLIDLGTSDTVDNALTPGEYVAGSNIILGAAGFNNDGGTNETLSPITITGTEGDTIALRWFPQITYAEFETGTYTPSAGDDFGTYTPGSGTPPDGGSAWVVPDPTAGSTIDLDFYTTDSDGRGTQAPSEGYANFVVSDEIDVPEPSTTALIAFGLLGLLVAARAKAFRTQPRA